MYVYIRSERNLYTVGHYDPTGQWHPESDWGDSRQAADRVAYLNGSTFETRVAALERRILFLIGNLEKRVGTLEDRVGTLEDREDTDWLTENLPRTAGPRVGRPAPALGVRAQNME